MNKQELIEKIKKMDSYMFNFRPHINETQVLNYIRQLDEPQKPVVPQFVADWIEVCKEHLTSSLYLATTPSFLKANNQGIELTIWIKKNEETFARAWLDGYEVEQEKRYLVKMKGMVEDFTVLKLDKIRDGWYLGNDTEYSYTKVKHTRKELEEAGFGWVFDCKGIEVKEVKE